MAPAPPINHRQVELFRAVMQAGSLSAAALALHSSQPTLSRDLARLEARLGYALFDRRAGSRLQPTAAAQALYATVLRHYEGLAQVQAQARALAHADAQQLQVLALPALAHALLPRALALGPAPVSRIAITPADSPLLEAWMAEQRHDLGLAERSAPVSGCRVERLVELAEVAVLPPDHALAARDRLDAPDFAGQPFISLADDDPYRAPIDAWFAEAGVTRQLRITTHNAVTACALVTHGLGLAIVNPFTALACRSERLTWRPLVRRIPYELALLWPLHRGRVHQRDALGQAVRAAAAEVAAAIAAPLTSPPRASSVRRSSARRKPAR